MLPILGVRSGEPPRFSPTGDQNDFVLGLDLGKAADYTALAADERSFWKDQHKAGEYLRHHAVRYLKRWDLGTPYTQIVQDVCDVVERVPAPWPLLAVDITGVGTAVLEMLKAARPKARVHPVLITGGHATTNENGVWHVPKKELVSVMVALLQSGRIQIAKGKFQQVLQDELQNFKVKITVAGNETFEAWRERDKDDMVLATAMAAWLGERGHPFRAPSEVPQPKVPHSPEERRKLRGSAWNRRGLFGTR
jgi:hypothetical protein